MLGDPTGLLMLIEGETAGFRAKAGNPGWTWRKGVEIFVAPESRCSFCDGIFETNRVYLIDTVNQIVPKQWRLKDGQPVKMGNKMYHPHAFHNNGGVCLNEATSMPQLLFNSISRNPNYQAQYYFWDVGHKCKDFAMSNCPFCLEEVPAFILYHTWGGKALCSVNCREAAAVSMCSRCFKPREGGDDNPDEFGPYCVDHLEYTRKLMKAREETKDD